jgi:hypothetical protein
MTNLLEEYANTDWSKVNSHWKKVTQEAARVISGIRSAQVTALLGSYIGKSINLPGVVTLYRLSTSEVLLASRIAYQCLQHPEYGLKTQVDWENSSLLEFRFLNGSVLILERDASLDGN